VSSLKGRVSAQVSRSSGFNLQPSSCDICVGHSGTGTGLCWTPWHWDRFVLDTVALGQVYVGHSGTWTGLWWTQWHWDRFVVDTVALEQVCGGHCGTGTGLWWTLWHWDRFVVDTVALGQVCGGHCGTGTGFPCEYFCLSPCQRHSTYARYPSFRLSPTLYNLSSYSIVKQTLWKIRDFFFAVLNMVSIALSFQACWSQPQTVSYSR